VTDGARRSIGVAADALASLALVAWVGGHAALGAFAARILFRDLPRATAASAMTTVFREFDTLIWGAIAIVIVAAAARIGTLGLRTRADRVAAGALAAIAALGCFEVAWVHLHIEEMFRAGRTLEPAFASLHALSARCANVEIALAAVFFVAQTLSRRHA